MGILRKIISIITGSSPSKGQALADFGRVKGYLFLLETRLTEHALQYRAIIDGLDLSQLSPKTERLHLEISEPAFEIRLFAYDHDWTEVFDETGQDQELERINAELDTMPALLRQDELDRFMIWENDPIHGRQVALEQPIDAANITGPFSTFALGITENLRKQFSGVVTAGFHDKKPDLLE